MNPRPSLGPAPVLATVPARALGRDPARLLKRAWDHASLYLPVILMGLLALGSYWIIGQSPAPAEPPAARAPVTGPGAVMQDFLLRDFGPDGQLLLKIEGVQLHHYPGAARLVVEQVRLQQRDAQGHLSFAQADRLESTTDRTVHRLSGNVVLLRPARAATATQAAVPEQEFRSQALTLYTQANRIESDQPVEIRSGAHLLRAQRMRYNQSTGQLELQGQVRATLAPPAQ
ncbi:uncharacterized protein conserved in bacteria [Serpentinimonas maccroryi]|uniref:Uncharacterized protein conserved in bacteria n=1 Tax=Serpentinimonas maccroryi TaxID=1458426 RepID=A0A060NWW5_9BURK|nr:LPS export ABC transporter periplasmic protein LptC [Serpentinimonas maccroryi]BAO84043.1 uncharacterized protein conserved in bacteria [Serpentinimonas maccroryi]